MPGTSNLPKIVVIREISSGKNSTVSKATAIKKINAGTHELNEILTADVQLFA